MALLGHVAILFVPRRDNFLANASALIMMILMDNFSLFGRGAARSPRHPVRSRGSPTTEPIDQIIENLTVFQSNVGLRGRLMLSEVIFAARSATSTMILHNLSELARANHAANVATEGVILLLLLPSSVVRPLVRILSLGRR